MALSTDKFQKLATFLAADQAGGDNKRTTPRQEVHASVTIRVPGPQDEPSFVAVRVRDLSPSGIGFIYPTPLPRGKHFDLQVPGGLDQPIVIPCVVARCQQLDATRYSIGARFSLFA